MAVLEKQEGRPASARTFLSQARDLYVRQRDEGRRLQATHTLGNILVFEGDLAGAERSFREVLAGAVARGSDEQAGLAQANLGSVLLWQGKLAEARRLTEGAIEAFARSGSRRSEVYALRNLARIRREEGALDEADTALGKAVEVEKAAGDAPGPEAIEARVEQLLSRQDAAGAADSLGALRAAIGKEAGEDERLSLFALEVRPRLRVVAARAQSGLGRHERAIRELEVVASEARNGRLLLVAFDAELARAEAELALGRRADARARLENVDSSAKPLGAAPVSVASCAVAAGSIRRGGFR